MSFQKLSIEVFLTRLADRTPSPGGGAGSALAGALGAALGAMSAAYTTGDDKYRDVEEHAESIQARLNHLRSELLDLADRDAAAYAQWAAARNLPKASQEEKAFRKSRLAEAREASIRIPEDLLSRSLHGLQILDQELAGICNPNLIADVAVSAQLLEAAARGACTQIWGNLAGQPNDPEVVGRGNRARQSRTECEGLRQKIEQSAFQKMGIPDDTR